MKQLIFFLNFMLFSTVISATHDTRELQAFTQLDVSEGISVELIHEDKNSALVHVENGNADDLITKVDNGRLSIYWKKNKGSNRYATVELSFVKLDMISSSSGSKVMSEFIISSNSLDLEASSGGDITLEIDCDNLSADVSSGSVLVLKGKSKVQDIDASSGGAYNAEELVSESATVDASSGAHIKLHVSKNLSVDASSGASIKYKGNPSNTDFDVNEITGASVSKM